MRHDIKSGKLRDSWPLTYRASTSMTHSTIVVAVAVTVAVLALAGCDYAQSLKPTTTESLVGIWDARNIDGDTLYLARLAADGKFAFTAPGEDEPYQTGRWSYDREKRTLTLGGSTIPVSSASDSTICLVPHPMQANRCLVIWTRVERS